MWAYIVRRILYAIPILIGVNLITFFLFFVVNSPQDMAVAHIGDRYVTQEAIDRWIKTNGYDKPLFYNEAAQGGEKITQTLFYQQSEKLFTFNFGTSDSGRDISYDISERMWPSLALALPSLFFGLIINISFALFMVFFRATYLDITGVTICVGLMSISSLFYIIGGQYLLAKVLHWMPISGYSPGLAAIPFLLLPVTVSVFAGIGSGVRWYRSIFLEEINKDYVRTARAKGLSQIKILFKHVLKNAMLPILTGVVVLIPSLFLGSLILESFFAIPGLGSYTIDAIRSQDFAIVRSMVFLGSVLYILGLILTDISYTLVDPRVRLN
ncbi:MAG: ABC transporter permease [Gammaproteobacteria bacterium]|jgi:peptide/nickel transport system permease protein